MRSSYTPPFVRSGLGSKGEDPFKSTSASPTHQHGSSRTPTAPKSSFKEKMMRKDWRSGSSSSDDESSATFSPSVVRSHGRDAARKLSFGVDHGSESAHSLVKPDDAQGIYPPSCCVFVAK